MKPTTKQSGFTLVELAIVLVIIGLIVGGVLVGQDLIKAASIRSVITDLEKYNAAATTFRGKYNGLPGDLLNTKAFEFGLNATAATDGNRDGSAGKGDGNGVIEACAVSANGFGCETGLFWVDLSRAAFIPASYNSYTSLTAALATANFAVNVPKTKLRDSTSVTVYNNAGRNYFAIGTTTMTAAIAAVATAGPLSYTASTSAASLSPLEARNMDEKMDDGSSQTGTVIALPNGAMGAGTTTITPDAPGASANNRCVLTGGSYMVDTDSHANNLACALSVRTSF
ncbi:MAG: type II secretion system protein [Rickettsiales bacterium]